MQLLTVYILAQMKLLKHDKDAIGVVQIKIGFHYSSVDMKWKSSVQMKMRRKSCFPGFPFLDIFTSGTYLSMNTKSKEKNV